MVLVVVALGTVAFFVNCEIYLVGASLFIVYYNAAHMWRMAARRGAAVCGDLQEVGCDFLVSVWRLQAKCGTAPSLMGRSAMANISRAHYYRYYLRLPANV